MANGWFGESRRHSEAAKKGRKTFINYPVAPSERAESKGSPDFRLSNGFLIKDAKKLGMREFNAIRQVADKLLAEGINKAGYDKYYDVFYFRGKNSMAKDIREGFVLSVTDAKTGSISSIYEPPNF